MKVSVAFVLAALAVTDALSVQQQKYLGTDSEAVEDRRQATIETFNNVITEAISRDLYDNEDSTGIGALFRHHKNRRVSWKASNSKFHFPKFGHHDGERPGRPDDGRPGRPDDERPGRPDDGRGPPHGGPNPDHPDKPGKRPLDPPDHGRPRRPRPDHPDKPGKRPLHPPDRGRPRRPHPPRIPWPPRPPHAPHGHPHHFDMNLFELLGKGNVTSKFFNMIKDDKEIKDLLTDTSKNFTILVPVNDAFDAPPHFDKPHHPPEFKGPLAHAIASYHIIPGFHDFYNLNLKKTLETYMEVPELGDKHARQRVRIGREVEEGFGEGPNPCRKTAINVISKVISADFFGTNGVVHAISHILLPPPPTLTLIHLFPTEFSTWMLAVWKSGMIDTIEGLAGKGLTIFPPSNRRWEELPWDIRTFLFSPHGEKYLKALVQYHVVPNIIQYTDEKYTHKEDLLSMKIEFESDEDESNEKDEPIVAWLKKGYFGKRPHGPNPGNWPRGRYHTDLPTLLEGKSISVDIMREGPWAKWRLNGGTGLFPNDIISREGVIQVPRGVLFPPRADKPPSTADFTNHPRNNIPQTVEDLKARFAGFVDDE